MYGGVGTRRVNRMLCSLGPVLRTDILPVFHFLASTPYVQIESMGLTQQEKQQKKSLEIADRSSSQNLLYACRLLSVLALPACLRLGALAGPDKLCEIDVRGSSSEEPAEQTIYTGRTRNVYIIN